MFFILSLSPFFFYLCVCVHILKSMEKVKRCFVYKKHVSKCLTTVVGKSILDTVGTGVFFVFCFFWPLRKNVHGI